MAGTRSSARLSQGSSPQSAKSTGGTKRKAEDSSPTSTKSKRGRPSKEQKTLEETLQGNDDGNENVDVEIKDIDANGEGKVQIWVCGVQNVLTGIRYCATW